MVKAMGTAMARTAETPIARVERKLSVEQAVEAYLFDLEAAERSPDTIRNYGFALAKLTDFLKAHGIEDWAEVTPGDLRQYLVDRQGDGLKPSSIGILATYICCFFNWLRDQGLVPFNPMMWVRRPKKPQRIVKVFTEAELRAIFAAAERAAEPIRETAAVYLLLDCGLRISELLAIRPSSYNPDTRTLTVIKGKGRKVRLLRLGQRSSEALGCYLQTTDGELWGLTRRQGSLTIANLGIPLGIKSNPHKFRHTFAMRFLDAGGTIDELQYLMGHSHIATTMIYAAAGQEQRALRSHTKHSPLDTLF